VDTHPSHLRQPIPSGPVCRASPSEPRRFFLVPSLKFRAQPHAVQWSTRDSLVSYEVWGMSEREQRGGQEKVPCCYDGLKNGYWANVFFEN